MICTSAPATCRILHQIHQVMSSLTPQMTSAGHESSAARQAPSSSRPDSTALLLHKNTRSRFQPTLRPRRKKPHRPESHDGEDHQDKPYNVSVQNLTSHALRENARKQCRRKSSYTANKRQRECVQRPQCRRGGRNVVQGKLYGREGHGDTSTQDGNKGENRPKNRPLITPQQEITQRIPQEEERPYRKTST